MLVLVGAFQAWSFVVTQRAFLYVPNIGFIEGPYPIVGRPMSIWVQMMNNGHTTGFVLKGVVAATLCDASAELPSVPNYSNVLSHVRGSAVVAGGLVI
jgi:hypothetical protein